MALSAEKSHDQEWSYIWQNQMGVEVLSRRNPSPFTKLENGPDYYVEQFVLYRQQLVVSVNHTSSTGTYA